MEGVVSYDVVIGFFFEVDSIVVVRAYGVVCYGIAAGIVEVDSIPAVRGVYILYPVCLLYTSPSPRD